MGTANITYELLHLIGLGICLWVFHLVFGKIFLRSGRVRRVRMNLLYFAEQYFCVSKRRAELIVGLYHLVICSIQLIGWQHRLLVNISSK